MPRHSSTDKRLTLSTKRIWLFRSLCIALALLPFLAAELYLRATRRVDSADLASDPIFDTGGRTRLFVESADTQRLAIPESRMNFFRPASFAAEKQANQRRVFVLGGSTVQGRPYETETAFAEWTEIRLRAFDPSHEYEIINCGGVSYASYRIAIILEEVLTYSPDAIVLYTGHNEFLEERSYNTIDVQNNAIAHFAQRSYLIRAIRRQIFAQSSERQSLSPELRTRLDLVDGMKRYVRDDQWRRGVVEHFRLTLDRMIRMCADAQVPLLLCVPTSDIVNTPPIKTQLANLGDESRKEFKLRMDLARHDDASREERIKACQACLEIDPHHAGAHFIAGSMHWVNERSAKARFHLTAARDHDVCPLRATTPIIRSILQLADDHDLQLIDCDRLFDQTDSRLRPLPDGIPDPQRFSDHVHPTIAGHQEIAYAISDRLMELFGIPLTESSEEKYRVRLLEHLTSLDESYFARGKQRLEGLKNWAAGRAGKYRVRATTK